MEILIPLLVALVPGVSVLVLATMSLTPQQRRFLLPVLLLALAIRIALSTIFAAIPETRIFHADSEGAEYVSQCIASYWLKEGPPFGTPARNYGLYYVLAAFRYLFGQYRLNCTVFTSIIGTLSIVLVYRIALRLFHELIARRAALLSAFFPSMIIWSAIALKDCVVTFLILLSLLFLLRLRDRFSPLSLVGTLLPIFAIYPIRFYMVYFLLAGFAGTLALNRPGKIVAGISKQVLLVAGLVAVVTTFGLTAAASSDMDFFTLDTMSNYRRGMASTANSGFAHDADVSTPIGAILFLPLGVTTMLWAPFPWQMVSLRPLLTLPEMLLWWSMIPALFRGARFLVSHRFTEMLPIIVFTSILLVGYGLTMGNVGAAFRMRAQILNLLFLFVAFGQYIRVAKRNKIEVSELLR